MNFLIGYLLFTAAAWLLFWLSSRRAPKDTDLWSIHTLLLDTDPETRAEILSRHPELLERQAAPQQEPAVEAQAAIQPAAPTSQDYDLLLTDNVMQPELELD